MVYDIFVCTGLQLDKNKDMWWKGDYTAWFGWNIENGKIAIKLPLKLLWTIQSFTLWCHLTTIIDEGSALL